MPWTSGRRAPTSGRVAAQGEGCALSGQLDELIPGDRRTELQQLVLDHDWSSTPLGASDQWSPTLRTAVSTALNSRFAMLLMWGRELVMVYNDGYAATLGPRHPGALGQRVPDVWGDVWGDIEGMIDDVFAGGTTYFEDLPLITNRHGFEEEAYFTFSYSPVVEPGGTIAGLLNTVVETTHRVLSARRLAVLQRLGQLPRSVHGSRSAAAGAALDVLGEAREDSPFGLVYLVGEGGSGPRLVAAHGLTDDGASLTGLLAGQLGRVIATGTPETVTGLVELLPGLSRPGASQAGEGDVETALVLPLTAAGASAPVGALVLGASPHLHLDEEYRVFLTLAAGQVAAAVADAEAVDAARRRAEERAELDRTRAQFFTDVAVTLQRAVLGPTVLPEGFAVHYEPASGTLEVGGDWYDVVDLPDGRYGVVVGDVVGRGLAAAAVMGQLRSAGRALLLESQSPAHALEALDRFAALVPGAAVSTVFCAVVDRSKKTLRYSSAGHPPAILVQADGTSGLLQEAGSLPLAVADGLARPEADLDLPDGATLLLYTDGLVERRNEAIDEGTARAVEVLTEGRHLQARQLADVLTERLLADSPDDDVAFLLYRCG